MMDIDYQIVKWDISSASIWWFIFYPQPPAVKVVAKKTTWGENASIVFKGVG